MVGPDDGRPHRRRQSLAEAHRDAITIPHDPAGFHLQVFTRVKQPRAVHVEREVVTLADG